MGVNKFSGRISCGTLQDSLARGVGLRVLRGGLLEVAASGGQREALNFGTRKMPLSPGGDASLGARVVEWPRAAELSVRTKT